MQIIKFALLAGLCFSLTACPKKSRPASGIAPGADLFSSHSIESFELRGTKTIALTFDDGPGAGTAEILNELKRYNIRATFFVLGRSARNYPALMSRIQADGHIVANHSYSHQNLTGRRYYSPSAITGDLQAVHGVIEQYQNPQHGKYFRAPFGAWRAQHASVLNADATLQEYIGPVFWDIGGDISSRSAADWACWSRGWSVEQCLNGYLTETHDKQGGVVLIHDITRNSAAMTSMYIQQLVSEGYKFVTLDEVRALNKYR